MFGKQIDQIHSRGVHSVEWSTGMESVEWSHWNGVTGMESVAGMESLEWSEAQRACDHF